MTYLALILATLAVRALITRLSARLRRPKFPRDICTGCHLHAAADPPCRRCNAAHCRHRRRERTDEQIDRLARRIHARHVRAELRG